LESQLVATTEKLKEVDSKAAFKIESLEQELQDTQKGMVEVVHKTQKQQHDQTDCIKELGKKLIRQAKVIKRQKQAIEQYRIQLEGLQEEMAMQDERDLDRDAAFQEQKNDFEKITEQKVAMQHSLQENIEEMMELKEEKEASAQRMMELEFDLQQKDATLARVAKETSEKTERICLLEEELEEKTKEVDVIQAELKASEKSL
jgi:chromosome segregation ATPase